MTEKTQAQYDKILDFLSDGEWHKMTEIVEILNVKETRTKELLRTMVQFELLKDNDVMKGQKYRKR